MKPSIALSEVRNISRSGYSYSSPAFAFPFQERPVFEEEMNLNDTFAIAAGGGIPILQLIEKGARNITVVDISANSTALAMLRLGASFLNFNTKFSRAMLYGDIHRWMEILQTILSKFPEIGAAIDMLKIDRLLLFENLIIPPEKDAEEYLHEFEISPSAKLSFVIDCIGNINAAQYTTLYISHFQTYAIETMPRFISTINDDASVVYTILLSDRTVTMRGSDFKEQFLLQASLAQNFVHSTGVLQPQHF